MRDAIVLVAASACLGACTAAPCPPTQQPASVVEGERGPREADRDAKGADAQPSEAGVESVCLDLAQFEEGWRALRRTRGDALVLRFTPTFSDIDAVASKAAAIEGVQTAEPFVVFEASILSVARMLSIPVQGRGRVSLERSAAHVTAGSLEALDAIAPPYGIALGRDVAASLGVVVGDEVGVWPMPVQSTFGVAGASKLTRVRVAAILAYPGGNALGLDASEVVMGVRPAVALWESTAGKDSGPTGVMLFYREGADARATLSNVEQGLSDPLYRVISHDELHKGLRNSAGMLREWCGASLTP